MKDLIKVLFVALIFSTACTEECPTTYYYEFTCYFSDGMHDTYSNGVYDMNMLSPKQAAVKWKSRCIDIGADSIRIEQYLVGECNIFSTPNYDKTFVVWQ